METKTIKRFSMGMMLVAFALMIAAAFGLPQSVFASSQDHENKVGETLTLTTPTDYTVEGSGTDSYVTLPTATFALGTLKVTAVTANSAKTSVAITNSETTTSPCTPKLTFKEGVNDYIVTYTLTNSNAVKTESVVKVSLDPAQVVFDWDINTTNIIPAKINLKTNGNYTKINLPKPTVKDVDGNEKDIDNLSVKVIDPNQNDISSQISDYVWTAKDGNTVGTYTVIYTYQDTNTRTKTQEFTFVLTEDAIDVNLKINGWKNSKTLPTSMALYVESELPQPTVVNTKASNAEVDVYTLIYLKCVPTDTTAQQTTYTNDASKTSTQGYTYCADLNNFKFTPTVAGKYTLTYVVQDFFGNKAEQSSNSNAITAEKTKASGQAYIVDTYAGADADESATQTNYEKLIEALENEVLQTAESKIPSYVGKGYTFDFPAIFGYDKAYGKESLSQLSYQITITYTKPDSTSATTMNFSSKTTATDGTSNRHLNPADPTTNVNLKDFEFEYAVDYKIRYLVSDINNNSLFDNTYTVKVDETEPSTKVVTKIGNEFGSIVKQGTELKFTVSASSTLASDSTTTADARPTIEVKYSIGALEKGNLPLHNDGYYYLDLSGGEFQTNQTVTITATATDDLGISNTVTKTVKVQTITADQDAPEVKSNIIFDDSWNGLDLDKIEAGTKLNIPLLVFADESSFSVSAKVLCNGKELSTGTWGNKGENESVYIGGQSFTASKVGTYYVVYEATDLSGNKTTKSFTFKVEGEEIPIINVGAFASSYEYGDEIDISNIAVTINGDEVDSSFYSNIITNIPRTQEKVNAMITELVAGRNYTDSETGIVYDHTKYTINGSILCLIEGNVANFADAQDLKTIIRAGQEGSITLTYWAVSESGQFNENPTSVTFDVSDTKGPEVVLDAQKITTQTYTDGTVKIYIPNATAKDYASGEYCDVTITAKYKSDTSNLTVIQDNSKAGYYGYVEATKVGIIEVTYSSKDSKGNAATVLSNGEENESLTYTISVGDVSAPVINVAELQNYVDEQNYKKGSTVSLDLSKLSITKNLSYESSTFAYTVTCAGETVSSATLDGSILSFTADSYGEYVVSFNVKDSSGTAADTKTVSFTIKKESSESTTSTTVWGTVLIIAVLVVLGVVIFLFAKPTKSKSKIKTDTDKKDDKKDNKNDKLEV